MKLTDWEVKVLDELVSNRYNEIHRKRKPDEQLLEIKQKLMKLLEKIDRSSAQRK